MKNTVILKEGWSIRKINPADSLDEKRIAEYSAGNSGELSAGMPAQVHEILLGYGKIEDPTVLGNTEKCLWVSESDWIYKCEFNATKAGKRQYLNFKGLDTLADIYLNGSHIASHNDMYIPLRVDVTETLRDTNTLLVHFHSPQEYLRHHSCAAIDSGKVAKHKLLRKPVHDFIDFLGTKPYFTNIGIFADVILETAEECELVYADIQAKLSDDYKNGILQITADGLGRLENGSLEITVTAPDGKVCGKLSVNLGKTGADEWAKNARLSIEEPALWWPRTLGGQPLYKVEVGLTDNGVLTDKVVKNIGFRKIEMAEPFDFTINGRPLKLWGACFAPTQRLTNVWSSRIANTLMDMVENANMNIMRIWGEGVPYPDELYDEADKRGLLLWQEFYMSYGMHPDEEWYKELCRKEAEYVVKRLKNRASVLMWCGGNETSMSVQYDHPGEKCYGDEIYLEDYKKICESLDPDRYYHPTSPYGGAFANSPREGDTHGYTHIWYVPGADYPVFLSENTRVSTPALKSMKKYMGDKLWPDGYTPMVRNHQEPPMPETWIERAPGGVWERTKNFEKFYDADNPEDLIYRLSSAHTQHIRETAERSRRGRPAYDTSGKRICKGHTVWKLNEPYPAFYSSMIDYYLEPNMPYYALRRANEPVLLSFDVGNDIYLWIVNDSAVAAGGTVVCDLFNPRTNSVIKEMRKEVTVSPDESKVIFRLDEFGQFRRENFLYARLEDKNGNVIARTNDYVDSERYLYFPDAALKLRQEGEELVIKADKFARCIELSGNDNGDEFGWFFQDNYFDLMPWETKRVRVLGKHSKGLVTAKARFSSHRAEIQYKK